MPNWTDQAAAIRKGEELDIDKLQSYLSRHLPEKEARLQTAQFPSGFSNLTYLIKWGEQELVLRRPPFGAKIKTAHDMGREYNILSQLIKVYPKVPKPLLFCEDETVLGAPFYVMERIRGVILRTSMPEKMIPVKDTMAGIAEALVDTFVELHAVDIEKAGLSDFGKPEGYVERQIKGWTKRYFNAKTDEITEIEKAAQWLSAHMPGESGHSLIHNDFKYDNLVLDTANWTKVIAVLDWEMATLGDPLMDLGSSMGYWVNHNDPGFFQQLKLSPTTLPGNPSRGELVEQYARKSGRQIDNIVFYYVYGLFKLAVIAQQIYFRYKKGFTKDKRFAKLIEGVRGCGIIALQAIRKKKIDDLF